MYCIVLNYHKLTDYPIDRENHTVYAEQFQEQMIYLKQENFQIIQPDELNRNAIYARSPKNCVLITFDDGNLSDFELALPILEKYNMRATFFIPTNKVSSHGHLSWEHLRIMHNRGMQIQSHSQSHRFMPDLSSKDLKTELNGSKQQIEEQLGSKVNYISIPHGFVSKSVIYEAKRAGYNAIFTSCPGLTLIHDRYDKIIKRNAITKQISIEKFSHLVNENPSYFRFQQKRYKIKQLFRQIVGSKNYYMLWRIFRKNG